MITYSRLGTYGRLGNQLWQIASTIGIAIQSGHSFSFPKWEYAEYMKNVPQYGASELEIESKLSTLALLEEPDSYYHVIKPSTQYNWDLVGYFQSWKYFEHCKDMIKWYLYFPTLELKGVAVHVRRGDYLGLNHIHPVLPLSYYKEAMKLFKGETFTIFSDDMQWCMENFKGKNINFFESNGNDFIDFSWMAGFDKFIIANSSFSWWPAYLSGSSEVIAPKVWVNNESHTDDRLPKEWTKLEI